MTMQSNNPFFQPLSTQSGFIRHKHSVYQNLNVKVHLKVQETTDTSHYPKKKKKKNSQE